MKAGTLKSVLLKFLERYLSQYFENVDSKQLQEETEKGDIRLKDLILREDVFDDLDLPLEVSAGLLRELRIKVPWHDLNGTPATVKGSGFSLLVKPKVSSSINPHEQELKRLSAKRERLKRMETEDRGWFRFTLTAFRGASRSGNSIFGRVFSRLIHNVEITLSKVHIRFEDTLTLQRPGGSIVTGATIEQVFIVGGEKEGHDVCPKTIDIKQVSVYMNIDSVTIGDKGISIKDTSRMMESLVVAPSKYTPVSYLVCPFSCHVDLQTCNQLPTTESEADEIPPQIVLNAVFAEGITSKMTQIQLGSILHIAEFFSTAKVREKYVVFRVARSPDGVMTTRERWKFAIDAVLHNISEARKAYTWSFLMGRRRDRKLYISLYQRRQNMSWLFPLSEAERQKLQDLEEKLAVEDILFFRLLAERGLKRDAERQGLTDQLEDSMKQQTESGLWNSLFPSSWRNKPSSEIHVSNSDLTSEELRRFFQAVGYDSTGKGLAGCPKGYMHKKINVEMQAFSFALLLGDEGSEKAFVQLNLSKLLTSFHQRTYDAEVSVSLHGFVLEDCNQSVDSRMRYLIHTGFEEKQPDFLSLKALTVERESPLYEQTGGSDLLEVTMHDLNLQWNQQTVMTLIEMFSPAVMLMDKGLSEIDAGPSYDLASLLIGNRDTPGGTMNTLSLRVKTWIETISLTLSNDIENQQILKLITTNCAFSWIVYSNSREINGRLGNIYVENLMVKPDSIYRRVLGLRDKGANLVQFSLRTYGEDEEEATGGAPKFDQLFKLRISSIYHVYFSSYAQLVARFIIDGGFLTLCSNLAHSLLARRATRRVIESTKTAVRQQRNMLTKVDVAVVSPVFLFPRSRDSEDGIALELGQVLVSNNFRKDNEYKVFLNSFSVNIKAAKMIARHGGNVSHVVDEIDVQWWLDMAVSQADETQRRVSRLRTAVSVSEIKVKLTETQYSLLVEILYKNISEGIAQNKINDNAKIRAAAAAAASDPRLLKRIEKTLLEKKKTSSPTEIELENTIRVRLAQVYVEICNDPVDEFDDPAPLAGFHIDEFVTQFEQYSTNGVKMVLSFNSVVLEDMRENVEGAFRKLISPYSFTGLQKSPELVVSFESEPSSNKRSISVELDHLRIVMVAEAFFAIVSFFVNGAKVLPSLDLSQQKISKLSDQLSSINSSLRPTLNVASNIAASAARESSLTIHFRMTNPQVCLLHYGLDHSCSVVIQFGLSIDFRLREGGNLSCNAALQKLEVYIPSLGGENVNESSLKPFDVTLDYSSHVSSDGFTHRQMSISCEGIRAQLTYTELRSLFWLARGWSKAFVKFWKQHGRQDVWFDVAQRWLRDINVFIDKKREKKQQKKAAGYSGSPAVGTTNPGSPDMKDRPASLLSVSSDKGEPPQAVSQPKKTTNSETSLVVVVDGVKLGLINDALSQNSPMLEIELDQSNLNLKGQVTHFSAWANVSKVAANYFNMKLAAWEPLLEPWPLQIEFQQSNSRMSVALQATEVMNVNITFAFLELLQTTSRSWSLDEKSSRERATSELTGSPARKSSFHPPKQVSPYWIRNNCGQNLTLKINDKTKEVPTGTMIPFSTGQESKRHRSMTLGGGAVPQLSMFIKLDGYHPISLPHVEKIGKYLYKLTPVDDARGCDIVVEVHLEEMSKIIEVRSSLQVVNHTYHPLDIRVDSADDDLIFGPVAAGALVPLPVHLVDSGNVRVRPSGKFGWSQEFMLYNLAPQSSDVACQLFEPESAWCRFVIAVDYSSAESCFSNSDKKEMVISVYTPLVLENLLPVPIKYMVTEQAKDTSVKGDNVLESGKDIPVPDANLSHVLDLVVKAEGYSWSKPAVINLPSVVSRIGSNVKVGKKIKLVDDKSNTVKLYIENRVGPGGSRRVSLWCRYWLVNNTELPICYRPVLVYRGPKGPASVIGEPKRRHSMDGGSTANGRPPLSPDTNGAHHGDGDGSTSTSAMLPTDSLNRSAESTDQQATEETLSMDLGCGSGYDDPFMFCFKKCHRVAVQVENSQWSRGVNLDVVGNAGVITMVDSKKGSETSRRYDIGVSIDLAPGKFRRTKVVTFTHHYSLINQTGRRISIRQADTMTSQTLQPDESSKFFWADNMKKLLLCMRLEGAGWLWTSGFSIDAVNDIAIKTRNSETQEVYIARVEVRLERAVVSVIFHPQNHDLTPYRIDNHSDHTLRYYQKSVQAIEELKPGSSSYFTWDEPARAPHILVVEMAGVIQREISLDEIRNHAPILIPDNGKERVYDVEVEAEGPTKVLCIADSEDMDRQKKQREKMQNELITKIVTTSATFAGITVSVVDDSPMEMFNIVIDDIIINYANSNVDQQVQATINRVQVDSQLYSSYFEVIFAPISQLPFLQLSLVKAHYSSNVTFFKYFSILLQEMEINIDEEILLAMLRLLAKVQITSKKSDSHGRNALAKRSNHRVYFDMMHLHPMKLRFSFVKSSRIKAQEFKDLGVGTGRIQQAIFRFLSLAISSIDKAPIHMNALVLTHAFCSLEMLATSLLKHYTAQTIREVSNVFGSLDLIGNPIGLVNSLGTGVYDFFYEPSQGLVKSPMDFTQGVAKGTISLVKHSVHGTMDSASKISSNMSKNIAYLSLDKSYAQQHRARIDRERPKHIVEGIMYGARNFGDGVFEGVSGVITNPVRGAKKRGFKGFVKGVGKGVVGMGIKPAVAVADLATKTAEGIRSTSSIDTQSPQRSRPPRYFGPSQLLSNFNYEESWGQHLMRQLKDGQFSSEYWQNHWILGRKVFIVANTKLILGRLDDNEVDWYVPLHTVSRVEMGPTSSIIVHHHHNNRGSPGQSVKHIAVGSEALCNEILAFLRSNLTMHSSDNSSPSRASSIVPVRSNSLYQ